MRERERDNEDKTDRQTDVLGTIIDSVTQVALPPALVQECDEGVNVGATGAAAHDGVGRNHW